MSDRLPDDGMDLGISPITVAGIIDAARQGEELRHEALDEELQDKETPEERVPASAMMDEVAGLIADLNSDEQAALIALVWIGRGDYAPEEWDETLRLARERNADLSAPAYLTGTDMLGDLLAEGMTAMGVPDEDTPR